jgi:hypothetical protein
MTIGGGQGRTRNGEELVGDGSSYYNDKNFFVDPVTVFESGI